MTMKRMRVLLIMTARETGGAEVYAERLVATLAHQCQFTLVMSDHAAMQPMCTRLSKIANMVVLPVDDTSKFLSIARRVTTLAHDHDIVHLNSNHPGSRLGIGMGFALGLQPVPFVAVEQRGTPLTDILVPSVLRPVLPALFRWSRHRAAKVIAVSRQNAEVLHNDYGIPSDKIVIVPNGAPMNESPVPLPACSLRDELGLRSDQPIVLVLSRMQANKGHRFLIDAAPAILARFPETHVVFAGLPDERASLEAHIARLGLAQSFSILGLRNDVPQLLHEASVYVLPSLAEGFSLALVEAMAAGLPCVATTVGGAPDIIRDGETGSLVPPANTTALANAVIHALQLSPEERQRLSASAHNAAKRFSVEAMAHATLAVYQSAAHAPAPNLPNTTT